MVKSNAAQYKQPLISVITVVYNGVHCIEDTIKSIVEQEYKNLEFILIDGGSTDGTLDVVDRYIESISFFLSERDNGIYDAMNKGWSVAKEDSYILFLGAGDRLISLPDDFSKYADSDIVFGRVYQGNNKVFNSRDGLELKIRNTLHHQALLIKKSMHLKAPFDLSYEIYADFDFNQRLLKKGFNFKYSDTFWAYAMPGGVSSDFDLSEWLSIIKKNFGLGWSFLALGYFLLRRGFVRSRDFILRNTSIKLRN